MRTMTKVKDDGFSIAGTPADSGGSSSLPVASSETLGGVKIGSGITISSDGTISTDSFGTKKHYDITGLSIDSGDYGLVVDSNFASTNTEKKLLLVTGYVQTIDPSSQVVRIINFNTNNQNILQLSLIVTTQDNVDGVLKLMIKTSSYFTINEIHFDVYYN